LPGLLAGERGFAAGVDATLFGRGDTLALAFEDQGAFVMPTGRLCRLDWW